jgi:hypothetical protein
VKHLRINLDSGYGCATSRGFVIGMMKLWRRVDAVAPQIGSSRENVVFV